MRAADYKLMPALRTPEFLVSGKRGLSYSERLWSKRCMEISDHNKQVTQWFKDSDDRAWNLMAWPFDTPARTKHARDYLARRAEQDKVDKFAGFKAPDDWTETAEIDAARLQAEEDLDDRMAREHEGEYSPRYIPRFEDM